MQLTELLKTTRKYFWNLGFDEVEIPYLNPTLPLEPNIYPFKTIWSQSKAEFYLPTSPEMALKKHLAATKKNCFTVSHCFRDLEAEGPYHTKEFLMLEYYLVNKNLSDLQQSLINYLSLFIKLPVTNYQLPIDLPQNEPDFNQFFLNEIEPQLPAGMVFVTGYPAYLSPLAATVDGGNVFFADIEPVSQTRRKQKKSLPNRQISQRFELYINNIEIANGCVENRNPDSIKNAFEQENTYRLKNHLPTHPYSAEFISDCASLLPCSGVGLGLERLNTIINTL